MKKYLFGIIALTLVVVFSAFVKNSFSPEQATTLTETALYWYPVNPITDEIDHTALINSGSKLTKTQMRDEELIPCPEGNGDDCIRGFNTVQNSDHSLGGVDATQKQ